MHRLSYAKGAAPCLGSLHGSLDSPAYRRCATMSGGYRLLCFVCVAGGITWLVASTEAPWITFTDVAVESGLIAPIIYGGEKTQKYILETTGTGVALFDYDGDDRPDIFLVNGSRLASLP